MAFLIKKLIRAYQLVLSPLLGNNCRFHPNCSEYFIEAVDKHGSVKGSYLGIRRLLRCNPLSRGYFDYVPETKSLLQINKKG